METSVETSLIVAPSTPAPRNNNSENPKRTGLKQQATQKNKKEFQISNGRKETVSFRSIWK